MPKSSRSRWGDFSEWQWEENQGFWYRVRQDAEGSSSPLLSRHFFNHMPSGNLDYDYDRQAGSASKPRTGDPVNEITRGLKTLSTGDYLEEG